MPCPSCRATNRSHYTWCKIHETKTNLKKKKRTFTEDDIKTIAKSKCFGNYNKEKRNCIKFAKSNKWCKLCKEFTVL